MMKTSARILILALVLVVFGSSAVYALDIKRRVLPSGLIVLQVQRHNLPIVQVRVLFKASPLDEPNEKAGLAYLTGALLSEGTKTRTSTAISEEIEFVGASVGTSVDMDYTTVDLSVLKKDVHKGFDILSDEILNPAFSADEMNRKKTNIKGSLRQLEENPPYHAHRALKKELFGDYAYGRQPQGAPESIDLITREDIVKFHSTYYAPNNAIMAIVGDVTEKEADALIEKYFGGWTSRPIPQRTPIPVKEPKHKVIAIEKNLTQATVVYAHIGVSRDNPDWYALSVTNYILGGGGFSSRLMQVVRDNMGLAYDIHSFFTQNKQPGIFIVQAQTKNESSNTVIAEIKKSVQRIIDEDVSDDELSGAKSFLTGNFAGRYDTMRKITDFICLLEFYGLGLDYMDKYPKYINALTPADLRRVAKKHLFPDDYLLIVVGDQSKVNLTEK